MQIKQKVEINFQFKRKNGVGDRKKVELILPKEIVYKLNNQDKGLPIIIPYLYPFIKEGEQITWYTYKTLIQDIDAENKKIEDLQKKEIEKQKKDDLNRKKENEKKVTKNKKNIEIQTDEDELTDEVELTDENELADENEVKSIQKTEKEKKIDNNKTEKEKIDLEYYKKQKEISFQNQIKNDKIENAKNELNNGGNKFLYYLKRIWYFLDKPWKKIAFVFAILVGFFFINEFFTKSSDKEKLITANVKFQEIYLQAQNELTTKNFEKTEILLIKLDSIIKNTKITNEFVIEEKNIIKKDWQSKYSEIKNLIDKSKEEN